MKRLFSFLTLLTLLLAPNLLKAQVLEWKFPLPAGMWGFEAAISATGIIYVPSSGNLLAINPTLVNVDPVTKLVTNPQTTTLWTYSFGNIINTPSVDPDGFIYLQSQPSGVMKLNSDGTPAWPAPFNAGGYWPGDDGASRIAIGQEGDIYLTRGGGRLYAIYGDTGLEKWETWDRFSEGIATPVIGKTGTLYSPGSYTLFAMDPTTKAATPLGAIPSNAFFPTLSATDDIYLLGNYWLYKIGTDQSVWNPQLYHGEYYAGQPVIGANGTIYFVTGASLWAVNPDGTTQWVYRPFNYNLSSTPIIGNDGTIYAASSTRLIAVNADGTLAGELTGYYSLGTPVMGADGKIYVPATDRNDNAYLLAIATSSTAPALSPWPMQGGNAQHTWQVGVRQLTVSTEPTTGGTVTVSPDKDWFPTGQEVTLTANPNTGYVFARWEWNDGANSATVNPLTLPMETALTVKAVFFKTFRNAVGDFYANIGDTGGWCTEYVKRETGINFSVDAYQWWQEAISNGYQTGSTPDYGAIIVYNQGSLEYGHVGIVVDYDTTTVTIRESNWCYPYCFQVGEHVENRNRSDILGYIYSNRPQN